MKQSKHLKINIKRFTAFISSLILSIIFLTISIDVIRFPEIYSSVWKYQLQNEIISGDAEAIAYYNRVYKSNGINLFDD